MNSPLVSIGLPVAGEPIRYLRQAVQSIQNQSVDDWELVVVADGAPTATLEFLASIEDPRVRIEAHEETVGLAGRLNQIADLARGEFLARMDADDVMHPTRLERQISMLQNNTGSDLIASRAAIIDENGAIRAITKPMQASFDQASMLAATPFVHPTVLARTTWWRAHRYPLRFIRSQDKALWIESAGDTHFLVDNSVALFYRVARAVDSRKYSRTARCERQILKVYGPEFVGHIATWQMVALSHVKQAAVWASAVTGRGDLIVSRRYVLLTDAQRHSLQAEFARAVAAPDPTSTDDSIDLDTGRALP